MAVEAELSHLRRLEEILAREKESAAAKVGAGFSEKTLASLSRLLRPLLRAKPAFAAAPREKGAQWLAPRLVAQIAFQEWTADRKLRQPVFLGLRDDKKPTECRMPKAP